MAETTSRRDPAAVSSPIVREAGELALSGFQDLGVVSQDQIALIFRTVAKECRNRDEQMLYLMTCKANGLSPLKRELYATRRGGQLVFVTAYGVFMGRAARKGFVIQGEAVCMFDKWGGWDAVKLQPVEHIIVAAEGDRGDVIGAYAWSEHINSGRRTTGGFWLWKELILDQSKAEQSGGLWGKMPEHQAKRVAWLRIARNISPDLASLYGPEEFGATLPMKEDPEAKLAAGPNATDGEIVDTAPPANTDGVDAPSPEEGSQVPSDEAGQRSLV